MLIKPLNPFGVEVVDLPAPRDVTTSVGETLRDALRRHHLLLFRGRQFTTDEQIDLVGLFGTVIDEFGDRKRHSFISNSREDGLGKSARPLPAHSDYLYIENPLSIISLAALELPSTPAPTIYFNGVAAAQTMPPELREELSSHTGIFVGGVGGYENVGRYGLTTASPEAPRCSHQLLFRDPLSSEVSVILDQRFCAKIDGVAEAKEEKLREATASVMYAPDNCYEHRWEIGDCVLWNNVAVQHGRSTIPHDDGRTLRRVIATVLDMDWDAELSVGRTRPTS